MNEIVRMYEILPSDTTTIRGWQGHKKEKKWFYCNSGSFIMNLIPVDNFDAPSKSLHPQKYVLEAHNPSVLEISGGYASGFKAQEENSKLIVFSNLSLEESKSDDFRFPVDYWSGKW
ncbi:MAG: sugar epimerase [Maribacter sp.]|uniref:sugar epimerase n=1 Tax=Maribacter sp. TaxID=1897614 RepID=UPI0032985F9B